MPKKKYLKIAENFGKLLIKEGIKVHSLYIFGSRARGIGHKWSDLDTCVVSSSFGRDPISEMASLFCLTTKVDTIIEPHPMSPADFADPDNALANEVKKHGIRII